MNFTKKLLCLAVIAFSITTSYAADYLWPFATGNNPAQSVTTPLSATVTPGMFSIGWTQYLPFSTNQGFWDLGSSGTITATSSSSGSTVTVETVEWYDGWIYGSYASISVTGASLLSDSYVVVEPWPRFFGNWVKHTQIFSHTGTWNLTVTGAYWGSVLGSLHVSD